MFFPAGVHSSKQPSKISPNKLLKKKIKKLALGQKIYVSLLRNYYGLL